jgi:hypothetical protein
MGGLALFRLTITLLSLAVGLAPGGGGAGGAAVEVTPIAGAAHKEYSPAAAAIKRQQGGGMGKMEVLDSTLNFCLDPNERQANYKQALKAIKWRETLLRINYGGS